MKSMRCPLQRQRHASRASSGGGLFVAQRKKVGPADVIALPQRLKGADKRRLAAKQGCAPVRYRGVRGDRTWPAVAKRARAALLAGYESVAIRKAAV